MAAGVFTASALPDILMQMEDIFVGQTPVMNEFQHPVMTAKLMLERQRVRTVPILEGTVCKGVKAYALQVGADLVTHDGSAERTTANCDITTGTELQTNGKTYDNNVVIEAVVEIEDGKCDNDLAFARESAAGLLKAMNDIKVRLNGKCIDLLEANVQPHQSNYTANATYIGGNATYNANAYKIAPANFDFEALLEIQRVAMMEEIQNPIILNVGFNFWHNERVAFYKSSTTTENHLNRVYNAYDIHWDVFNVSQLSTARETTFVFSPDAMLFWNTTIAQNTVPEVIDPSSNRWAYVINDPELMYSKDGRLVPVQYDVRYEYACAGKTTLGQEKYLHKYEVTLRGGLDIAPTGFNKEAVPVNEMTGVIEFVAEV